MSALFCLFLCFRSYSEKLEEYISTFYKIRYILEELYVAVTPIISRLIICIDQLNEGLLLQKCCQTGSNKDNKTVYSVQCIRSVMESIWVGLSDFFSIKENILVLHSLLNHFSMGILSRCWSCQTELSFVGFYQSNQADFSPISTLICLI